MAAPTPATSQDAPDGSLEVEVVVVGAGAAGLYAAVCAAREGARVALVSSSPLAASASYWAQGGVAAALAPEDSPELHAEDTLAAGRGASRPSAVRVLCAEAATCVDDLASLGIRFDQKDSHTRPLVGRGWLDEQLVPLAKAAADKHVAPCAPEPTSCE